MRKRANLILLAPIPALLVGAIAMHQSGISPFLYGQNILCYLAFGLAVLFLSARSISIPHSKPVVVALLAFCCAMLITTFLDKGLENVHRWITLGNFRLYISSLILPSTLIGIGFLLKGKNHIPAIAIAAIVGVCLALQPDASQLTAFAIAMVFLVWMRAGNPVLKLCVTLLCAALIIYSWVNLDALAPVPQVEGILFLALDVGVVWFALGIISLVLLILPFFTLLGNNDNAKAVGLYYFAIIASTFFGHFPVPIMGQGISPIIGYLLGTFLLFSQKSEITEKQARC